MEWDSVEKNSIDYFVDYSRSYFYFLIESKQWSGISIGDLNKWIKNFEQIEYGEYLACKILSETIGYSEGDVVQMLEDAISDILNREIVIPRQLMSNFSEMKSTLEYDLRKAVDNTLFLPLTVRGEPGESGDAILRLMTQKLDFKINKLFAYDIDEAYKTDRIIIVDDCIGSGEQFTTYWTEAEIKSGKKLRQWCLEHNIKVYYVVLVACKDAVYRLKEDFPDCDFLCVELLSENYKIFSELSKDKIFSMNIEQLEKYLSEINIRLYGFADLDYAIFINNNIPDWTIPMLHKSRLEWQPLLRRKDSND